MLISTVELIKQNTGGNGERHTWVHPQVAINIAQWISPQFDVKVSAWVLEVETLVFCKLNDYREQVNRERFLLPERGKIDLFIDKNKDCINFVK